MLLVAAAPPALVTRDAVVSRFPYLRLWKRFTGARGPGRASSLGLGRRQRMWEAALRIWEALKSLGGRELHFATVLNLCFDPSSIFDYFG